MQSSSSPSCPLTDQAMVASCPTVQRPVGSRIDQPEMREGSLGPKISQVQFITNFRQTSGMRHHPIAVSP